MFAIDRHARALWCACLAATLPSGVGAFTPPARPSTEQIRQVPAPTYAADSLLAGAWGALQYERGVCGFGLLIQNPRLDAAAHAHARYLARSTLERWQRGGTGSDFGPWEDASRPHYTGLTPLERARAQGWPNVMPGARVSEVEAAWVTRLPGSRSERQPTNEYAQGVALLRHAIRHPYDLLMAMRPDREIGLGVVYATSLAADDPGWRFEARQLVATFGGSVARPQRLGQGRLAHYPCDQSLTVTAAWRPSRPGDALLTPNDNAGDAAGWSRARGTPILLLADPGVTLDVTYAKLTRRGDGRALPLTAVHQGNDPQRWLGAHEWLFVPQGPLVPHQVYDVTLAGWLDGRAFTRSFQFTPIPEVTSD